MALVTDVLKMIGFAVALFLVDARLALFTFLVVPFLAVVGRRRLVVVPETVRPVAGRAIPPGLRDTAGRLRGRPGIVPLGRCRVAAVG